MLTAPARTLVTDFESALLRRDIFRAETVAMSLLHLDLRMSSPQPPLNLPIP